MRFGEKIRDLRLRNRLSQKVLSEIVGVSDAYLSKVENQKLDFGEFPSENLIARLAEALDGDETELLVLAEKIPDFVRRRFFERPEVFLQLAELDDDALDQLVAQLR